MEVVQDTGYGLIPRSIMRDEEISVTAKAIYSYLASFAGNTGKSFPSTSLIAKELSLSKNTLFKYLKELKDKGVITVEREQEEGNKFGRNIYYLHNEINKKEDEKPCTKSSDMEKPYTEKPYTVNCDTNSNNSNSNNSNSNKYIYTDIFKAWKEADIIQHRSITNKMRNKIKTRLKEYTEEEIKRSIKNYSLIVNDDNYYFTHKWTLIEFLDRGIDKFIDLDVAKSNYIKKETSSKDSNNFHNFSGRVKDKTESDVDDIAKKKRDEYFKRIKKER